MPLCQSQRRLLQRTLLVLLCGSVAFLGWYVVNFARRDLREAIERSSGEIPYRLNGSEPDTVRKRQQLLREIVHSGGFAIRGDESATIPEVRKRLGDSSHGFVFVPDDLFTLADVDNIKKAFPEAEIVYSSPERLRRLRTEVAED